MQSVNVEMQLQEECTCRSSCSKTELQRPSTTDTFFAASANHSHYHEKKHLYLRTTPFLFGGEASRHTSFCFAAFLGVLVWLPLPLSSCKAWNTLTYCSF
jgi:hypothetical protein